MAIQLRNWGLYSNLHISIVAVGILLSSYALTGMTPDYGYVLLAASGALLVYHTDRAFFKASEDVSNAPERLLWYREHRAYLFISTLLACVGVLWGASIVDPDVRVFGIAIGMAGLMYAAPLPFTSKRIKDVPFLKTVLIVACWVVGGVILPTKDGIPTQELILLASYKFVYILPNVLMAEWVDRTGDQKHGVVTVGARLSLKAIQIITAIGLLVSMLVVWYWSLLFASVNVLAIDLLGMMGMFLTMFAKGSWDGERIILLDLWVGFGLVTWVFWVMTQ